MKKMLITGFEPFGGERINPSWEAVSLLPDIIGEYNLIKLLIPVVLVKRRKRLSKGRTRCSPTQFCVSVKRAVETP